jgi:four helix bundle protein
MENQKIKSFIDLKVWQTGHKVVLNVYKFTKLFPKEELYGLTSQLRRAAVSITSNIAEGFSRSGPADKARFYSIALGSVTELQNQLLIAKDLFYLNETDCPKISTELVEIHKMLNGLIKSVLSRP